MKSIFYFVFLFSSLAFSQTNGITYQAVIYNPADANNSYAPLTNQNVCLQFSVMASDGTTVEYQEQVNINTDVFGMVNLLIGTNTRTGGTASDFDQIQWTSAAKSLKVDLDINGNCSNFEELSNKLFTYVPFAYYSRNNATGPQGPTGPTGPTGPAGTDGTNGTNGNGITSTVDNGDGTFTLNFDTGTSFTTSNLTGPTGPQGLQGPAGPAGTNGTNGNGITSTEDNGNGTFTLNFDTGTSFTTSNLTGPAGPQGPAGPAGQGGVTTVGGGLELTGTGTVSDPYVITLPTGGSEGQVLQIINGVPSWQDFVQLAGDITDQDGNSLAIETYCDKVWTTAAAENETYRDGTPIPYVPYKNDWRYNTGNTGAWCYFNNDPAERKLYNWYAIKGIHDAASLTDPSLRKEFAPAGWHVPTAAEWTALENCLIASGYNYDGTTSGNKIAKSMASTTGWNSSDVAGTPGNNQSSNNSSGFNVLPTGFRSGNGSDFNGGDTVVFWISDTSVINGEERTHGRQISLSSVDLLYGTFYKLDGFAVRFIKD